MAEAFELLAGGPNTYIRNFKGRTVGFERRANGNVILCVAEGGKADGPDAQAHRAGQVNYWTEEFTPDEWREVERKLQIAK